MINFNPKNAVAPERGKILISEPFLNDPYFKRTVVIICEHNNDEGTFGFILNKYLDINLEDLIPDFPEFEGKVSMGGPVEQSSLYFLHTRADLLKDSKPVLDNLCIGSSFSELKHFISLGLIQPEEVRFFVGYSGWTKGQLQQELNERAWIVAATAVENIMNTNDDKLWQHALTDLGKEFAILANFPEDPSLN